MRRRILLRRGAIIASLGLAGCIGSPAGDPTEVPGGADPTESPVPTDPPAMSPTASPPTAATGTPPDASTEMPTESPTAVPTTTDPPDPDQTVIVGPAGELSFAPRSFDIAAGETVHWTWEAGGHNVRPSAMPDGADWPGTAGGDSRTYGAGHTYSYTFDVTGTYEYYCAPHRAAGMTGSFTVG